MYKDTRTAWYQEFSARREGWDTINQLKAELKKVTAERDEYIKFHTENLPLISYIAIETVNVKVDGDIKSRFGFYLAKRDLEQQAKGVEDSLYDCVSSYGDTKVYVTDLKRIVKNLREQANEVGK